MTGIKIAVTGKGGVGKSTLTAVFAHLAAGEGRRVLAVDADPDANLAAALGMPKAERDKIVPLSQKCALIEERTGAKVRKYGQVFKLNPEVSDIVDKESALFRSIHLLVLGAIESGGSGCACPENVMLRSLLMDVVLYRSDCVLVDMEAGLEHMGRATSQGVDLMVIVAEPGSRSVETIDHVYDMAGEIGLERIAVVGNKINGDADRRFLDEALRNRDYIGWIPFAEAIRESDRDDRTLIDAMEPTLRENFASIWRDVSARASAARHQ